MSVSAHSPAITACFFDSALTAAIWSRNCAAFSNRRASASRTISASSSRISSFGCPSSSRTARAIRRWYSSPSIPGASARQNPSQRPMWKSRHGRSAPMSRGSFLRHVGRRRAAWTASRAARVSPRDPNGPNHFAPSSAYRSASSKRGHDASVSFVSRTKGYPLSSFNRMLYRGICRLMSESSRIRASNSLVTTIMSKWSIWDTMRRVFSEWPALSWKYWLTLFLSFFALPT